MRWRQWYEWMPRRWLAEQAIAQRYMVNTAAQINGDGTAMIRGAYPLSDRYGHVRDTFELRIQYPSDFLPLYPTVENPWCFQSHPEVFLDSHRDVWLACAEAHIFSHWRLCLFVPGESGIDICRADALERIFESVSTFLTKERYFQRDLALEIAGGSKAIWPGPDRAHLVEGYWEAVQTMGGLPDSDQCVCGRRRRYGDCCRPAVDAYALKRSDAPHLLAG